MDKDLSWRFLLTWTFHKRFYLQEFIMMIFMGLYREDITFLMVARDLKGPFAVNNFRGLRVLEVVDE